jgi:hypothetical protein
MTDGFYHKKNDGTDRDSMGRLYFGGVVARFHLEIEGNGTSNKELEMRYATKGWKLWLVKELSKVSGGMDGLTRTNTGYTNQPDAVPGVEA